MRDFPLLLDSFTLKVTLRHIEPAVWRELQVPARLSLAQLHDVLQVAFGWKNSHFHDFTAGDIRFGMADAHDEIFSVDERAAPLGAIAEVGSTFLYRYDFGDDWEHEVIVKGVVRNSETKIVCSAGARACPPEDSGGPPGYEQLLATLSDRESEEYQESEALGRPSVRSRAPRSARCEQEARDACQVFCASSPAVVPPHRASGKKVAVGGNRALGVPDPKPMRLLFDHGTLVLAETPDLSLDFVPGLLWDDRVALFRAPAWRYADVVDALSARKVPVRDEVRSSRSSLTDPWKPLELRRRRGLAAASSAGA